MFYRTVYRTPFAMSRALKEEPCFGGEEFLVLASEDNAFSSTFTPAKSKYVMCARRRSWFDPSNKTNIAILRYIEGGIGFISTCTTASFATKDYRGDFNTLQIMRQVVKIQLFVGSVSICYHCGAWLPFVIPLQYTAPPSGLVVGSSPFLDGQCQRLAAIVLV